MIVYSTQCLRIVWIISCIGTQNTKVSPKNVYQEHINCVESQDERADGQEHYIYSKNKNKNEYKDFPSRICVKSVDSIFHHFATDTKVQRHKSRFFFVGVCLLNLGLETSYRNTFVVWLSGSQSVLSYLKGSVTSSQSIRGYISKMATWKFIMV